jgi:lipase
MTGLTLGEDYAQVPEEQKQLLAKFRSDHPCSTLDIDGTRWRYIACGQGDRALLFLPGGFLSADMWFHAILALEKAYRIIAPDAFTLQGTFDMDDVCNALLRILDAEGIEKATVIGLSAGGGVAQYMLQKHPERMEHVVLSHCGVIERTPESDRAMKRFLTLARWMPLWFIRRTLLKQTTGHVPPSSRWIEFHNAYFREAGARFSKEMLLRFLQSGIELRQRFVFDPEVVASWPGRVLLLASRDDEMAVASLERLEALYPQAETHLFDEGGHHTFMFFPEAYTDALSAFLEAAKGQAE